MSDAGEQHTEIVVYLGRCANGGTWIAGDDFLLDGDGGRDAADEIALGLVHAAEELSGIARQALHITPLTFGIQCVEGQR